MKQRTKALIATLTLMLMLPFMMIPASANSALTEWEGRKENVVMTTDGESPIVVEHETLTFDIQELVDTYHNDDYDPSKEYKSSVTAEYHFYNPSDMTVTAELAFPIGTLINGYINEYAKENYLIKVNGETIEHEVRHTYSSYSEFDLEYDLPRLKDDYTTHRLVTQDTKVTKYKLRLELTDKNTSGTLRVYIDIDPKDYENTKIYCPDFSATKLDNGMIRLSNIRVDDYEDIYFIGEVPENLPKLTVYEDIFDSDEIRVLSSKTSAQATEEMTFRDLALKYYNGENGISEMDWYNAAMLGVSDSSPVIFPYYIELRTRDFLCWYTYELEFEPGERIVNSVTAPMIPGQNLNYNPRYFKYNYLISPAVTWADFGSLDIYVNTPYYLVESNIDGFEKTESGYYLHLDGLPMSKKRLDIGWDEIKIAEPEVQDLYFALCESESPQKKTSKSTLGIILIIVFFPIILVVWIVNLCIQGVKRVFAK